MTFFQSLQYFEDQCFHLDQRLRIKLQAFESYSQSLFSGASLPVSHLQREIFLLVQSFRFTLSYMNERGMWKWVFISAFIIMYSIFLIPIFPEIHQAPTYGAVFSLFWFHFISPFTILQLVVDRHEHSIALLCLCYIQNNL